MLEPWVVQMLACPKCKGPVTLRREEQPRLECANCGSIYGLKDDVPIMLADEPPGLLTAGRPWCLPARPTGSGMDDLIASRRDTQPQVDATHYYQMDYDTKERFASYWHQLRETMVLRPNLVVEIGKGNGLFSWYLASRGVRVLTLDIDPEVRPSVVGSVLQMPIADASADVVCAFQVLEHIPFDSVTLALREMSRVTRRWVLVSLPDSTRSYRGLVQLPKVGVVRWLIEVPRLRPPVHRFDGEHYWELGKAGYSVGRVVNAFLEAGLRCVKSYRVYENPYHRFFLLRKQGG